MLLASLIPFALCFASFRFLRSSSYRLATPTHSPLLYCVSVFPSLLRRLVFHLSFTRPVSDSIPSRSIRSIVSRPVSSCRSSVTFLLQTTLGSKLSPLPLISNLTLSFLTARSHPPFQTLPSFLNLHSPSAISNSNTHNTNYRTVRNRHDKRRPPRCHRIICSTTALPIRTRRVRGGLGYPGE